MLPYLDQNSLMDRLNGIKNLGTGWVRFDVDWSDVQGDGPNNYDWSNYDRLIAGLNATGIKGLGIIDEVIPEPTGGAHTNHDATAKRVMRQVQLAISGLETLDPAERLRLRHEKYLKMGRWMEPGLPEAPGA